MTGFKTFICSCVYFHFHTDDGLSKYRNVCTYCYAHKIMKFITFALVFSFIFCLFRRHRTRDGGGVVFYIKSELMHESFEDLNRDIESLGQDYN